MSNELIKITELPTQVMYLAAGKEMKLQLTTETTREDYLILRALSSIKVSEAPEETLNTVIPAFINKAVLLLGHKNQMAGDADQALLASEIKKLLKSKWHFYTVEEVKVVFDLGLRGDFKSKEDSVVYLNIEIINSWFKKYRTERKPKAMKTTKLVEPAKEPMFQPLQFLKEGLQKIAEETITPLDYRMLTAAYYDRFKKAGLLPNKPMEEWQKMILEERQRALDRGNKNLDMLQDKSRKSFSTFKDAFKNGKALTDNSYEEEAMNACRVRVFTETLQRLAWEETDVDTLTF